MFKVLFDLQVSYFKLTLASGYMAFFSPVTYAFSHLSLSNSNVGAVLFSHVESPVSCRFELLSAFTSFRSEEYL